MKIAPPQLLVRVAGGVCGLIGMSGCVSTPPSQNQPFRVAEKEFTSHGVKILVDVYTPTEPRTGPAHPPALVLHGAGGMLFDGPEMSRVARELATAGFEAYQVHYFDRTHTWFARQSVLLKLFPTWRETVHDAVAWVQTERPDVGKVGIFGYSLGAFAGIEEARRNPAIGAVVEHAGGFWNAQPKGPTRQPLPPILLIHGLEDERVPFGKYAKPLLAFLRTHRDPFATHFYPGEGHNFSPAALHQVRGEAVVFFQRHLAVPAR